MKNKLKIFTILIFLISCKNQNESVAKQVNSNFNLENDYAEFQTKMSELDTISVWVAIPSCFPPLEVELLTITKKDKLITILTKYNNDILKTKDFIEQNQITISKNDTVWRFGEFLKNNNFRTKIESEKQGVIQLKHKSQIIHFYILNKSEHNRFIKEYSETMQRINPEARSYVEEIEIVE